MLDTVSCWYFDWATVGTWVGGLGAAAAAWAAVSTTNKATERRINFAAYLLARDVEELTAALKKLESIERLLRDYEHPNPNEHAIIKSALIQQRKYFGQSVQQLRYFGSDIEQFEYRPQCIEFAALVNTYKDLLKLNDLIEHLWWEIDIDVAADSVKQTRSELEQVLKQWAAVSDQYQPHECAWCLLSRLCRLLKK